MAGTLDQVMPSPIRIEEDEQENIARIKELKAQYGERVIVLAHHYQRLGVHACGDVTGDSYALCKAAANTGKARDIIFCGVRFMVTSAATLCRNDQQVYHPDRNAGCPMADMANLPQVLRSWLELGEFVDTRQVIPVVYMNSDLDLKAFCGERNGIVCTSSNARKVFDWSFARGKKIFFFPDEHLGRNTANAYGIARDEIILWDPHHVHGGHSAQAIEKARVILWKGYCHVHTRYTVDMVHEVRARHPGIKIVVHPECTEDVVKIADAVGSTNFIQEYVRKMKPGDKVAIGTEVNMIHRMSVQNPDRLVIPIVRSLCPNMFKISTRDLRDCLEQLDTWEPVKVDPREQHFAKLALDNMLACAG
ncbi:MAG: quinolinate synthase A [Planctomycetota bacterium]|nr:quinolinate synthase NadA [Planctomycetota bacterium]GIK53171.1 MAG: quinolinate synthase A [Planctomycetota bacterium]